MGYRQDATEIGDARRRVEALVSSLPGAGERPQYEWSEFQLSLIQAIKQWEQGHGGEPWSYYEHWLTALETVLAGSGALSEAALDERTRAVLQTPKNANHHVAHREPVAIDPAR